MVVAEEGSNWIDPPQDAEMDSNTNILNALVVFSHVCGREDIHLKSVEWISQIHSI